MGRDRSDGGATGDVGRHRGTRIRQQQSYSASLSSQPAKNRENSWRRRSCLPSRHSCRDCFFGGGERPPRRISALQAGMPAPRRTRSYADPIATRFAASLRSAFSSGQGTVYGTSSCCRSGSATQRSTRQPGNRVGRPRPQLMRACGMAWEQASGSPTLEPLYPPPRCRTQRRDAGGDGSAIVQA